MQIYYEFFISATISSPKMTRDSNELNVPLHVLCTFFVLYIIKGSAYGSYTAYGSYSLRTVFASIVLRSLVLRSVWSSFVESFGLFVLRENFASCLDRFVRLLDCSVLRGELCFVFGSICAIIDRCSVLRGELCFVFGSIV